MYIEYSAAFFLLADHLREAANVCINQLGDIQLAIAITRAYEGDGGPVLKEILEERVLADAASEGNRWMASWAFWMLNRKSSAVRALIVSIAVLSHMLQQLFLTKNSPPWIPSYRRPLHHREVPA